MDPVSLVVAPVITQLAIHAGKALIDRLMNAPRGSASQGIVVDPVRGVQQIHSASGSLAVTAVTTPDVNDDVTAESLIVYGEFLESESFSWRGDETILLLLIEETDEGTADGQVSLFRFDPPGYELELWPSDYSVYAFAIAPLLNSQIIGIGLPDVDSEEDDPNPISLSGNESLVLNLAFYDKEAFSEAPDFIDEWIQE